MLLNYTEKSVNFQKHNLGPYLHAYSMLKNTKISQKNEHFRKIKKKLVYLTKISDTSKLFS